jgi:phosphoglycerate dehydrogenase-like enzyme
VISVHLALTPETRHFLDAERISAIAESALLVHLAPPELLDLPSLTRRLRDGSLRFVTDHGDEMDRRDVEALSETGGCTFYPPIGYGTREAQAARRARFLGELKSFLG